MSSAAENPAAPIALNDQNLIWIDLEMTGLSPERDSIIELAVVVTDPQLTLRVDGPVFAIRQSDATLDAMDAWNKSTHGKSGLVERVRTSPHNEAAVEAAVIQWLRSYVGPSKSPMCGNTICQDRRFLANHMPKLEAFFHYRNLDVSTLKELARRWRPALLDNLKKNQAHTALADVHESIDELQYYRTNWLDA
jgi:oligoribonuclease